MLLPVLWLGQAVAESFQMFPAPPRHHVQQPTTLLERIAHSVDAAPLLPCDAAGRRGICEQAAVVEVDELNQLWHVRVHVVHLCVA